MQENELEQQLFYYLACVPLLGIVAQWLAWRLRVPSILLLLGFGVSLGAWVNPDEMLAEIMGADPSVGPKLLFPIVSLSVAVILFEGGLTLRFAELREAGGAVLRLVTFGALITWVLTTFAAAWIVGLDIRVAALIGAILVVTGPTVVAPMLRLIQPKRRLSSTIKWEGIVIDPIGAVLAVLVFEIVIAGSEHITPGGVVVLLLKTTAVSSVLGIVVAWLLVAVIKRYWVPDFLHGVLFLTVALGVFALSNSIQSESGLVTVTILGIALANQKSIPIHHVVEFKEHLRVLLISCLFIVLGSRINPGDILSLGIQGLLFVAVLILIVRPAAVFISMIRSGLNWREQLFLAFIAPRGIVAAAVSSVFALELASLSGESPELTDLARQADQLVPLTFLVIVGTVFVYGMISAPLARRLGVSDPNPQGILFAGAEAWIRKVAKSVLESGHQVLLIDTSFANVAAAKMDGLPAECCSILSEHIYDELDLSGLGRLLALTPNDEVNTLAVREFAHIFGRENVYQLSPWDEGSGRRQSISEHLRGRILFEPGINHDAMDRLFEDGWVVKKTKLTDAFTFDNFQEIYGDEFVLLFVLSESGSLQVCTEQTNTKPRSGDTVIAVIDPLNSNTEVEPTNSQEQPTG